MTSSIPALTTSGLNVVTDKHRMVVLPAIRHDDQLYITLVLSGFSTSEYPQVNISAALEAGDASRLLPVSQGGSGEPNVIRFNIVFEGLRDTTSNYVLTIPGPMISGDARIAFNDIY